MRNWNWDPFRGVRSLAGDPRLLFSCCLLVAVETLLLVAVTRGMDLGAQPGLGEAWRVPALVLGWAVVASMPAGIVSTAYAREFRGADAAAFDQRALRRTVAATVVAHLVLVAWWICLTALTVAGTVVIGTATELVLGTLGRDSFVVWRHAWVAIAWIPFVGTLAAVPFVCFAGPLARTTDCSPRRAWRESLRSRLARPRATAVYGLFVGSVLWLPLGIVGVALLSGSGPLGYLGGAVVLLIPRLLVVSLRVAQFDEGSGESVERDPVRAVRLRLAGVGGAALAVLLLSGSALGVVRVADVHLGGTQGPPGPVEGKPPDAMVAAATDALGQVDHRSSRHSADGEVFVRFAYDHDRRRVLYVEDRIGMEGDHSVGVVYAAEGVYAYCYEETSFFNGSPERCRGIDVHSFDLRNVTGTWSVDAEPGYHRITEGWEVRPPELSRPGVDWRVENRTGERIVLVADGLSSRYGTDTTRAVLDRETGYLRRVVTTGPGPVQNASQTTVWRFGDYGAVDVRRPEGVRASGIGGLYWDLATY